jgi:hypothetical protein
MARDPLRQTHGGDDGEDSGVGMTSGGCEARSGKRSVSGAAVTSHLVGEHRMISFQHVHGATFSASARPVEGPKHFAKLRDLRGIVGA